MSIATFIIGESGTGKSSSLRNLDPDKTLLIQSIKKPLPFQSINWKPCVKGAGGSIFHTDNSAHIVSAMSKTTREIIIIDDFQYILANEFMRQVTDATTGHQTFAKYNSIARHAWDVLMEAANLAENKRVYILSHTTTDELGKTKIKTIGKLLDEKIVLEGLVSIVLKTVVINGNYLFSTKNNGSDTVKAPMGLFNDEHIPNDLTEVDKKICAYYNINPVVLTPNYPKPTHIVTAPTSIN